MLKPNRVFVLVSFPGEDPRRDGGHARRNLRLGGREGGESRGRVVGREGGKGIGRGTGRRRNTERRERERERLSSPAPGITRYHLDE